MATQLYSSSSVHTLYRWHRRLCNTPLVFYPSCRFPSHTKGWDWISSQLTRSISHGFLMPTFTFTKPRPGGSLYFLVFSPVHAERLTFYWGIRNRRWCGCLCPTESIHPISHTLHRDLRSIYGKAHGRWTRKLRLPIALHVAYEGGQ